MLLEVPLPYLLEYYLLFFPVFSLLPPLLRVHLPITDVHLSLFNIACKRVNLPGTTCSDLHCSFAQLLLLGHLLSYFAETDFFLDDCLPTDLLCSITRDL